LEIATVSTPPEAVVIGTAARLRGRKRWRLRSTPLRGRLAHSGLPKLVAQVLENRGIGSMSEAQRFLGGRDTPLGDSSLLPGFEDALRLLTDAVDAGTPVSVYGDFDVDGITSTAILTETLRDLGGEVLPYIPHREREGYGLNLRAIDYLADRGVGVLMTCDCGTTSIAEVEHARSLGMEVIVVDHHLPPALLPDTPALINPKLPQGRYRFLDYATAGIAFRLAEALYDSSRRAFPEDRYVELAALGTVADMVPLLDENRELVRRGLDAVTRTQRPGLKALIEVSGLKAKSVTSESIAFSLAPRLNAAGRLADARLALELLLTQEEGTARSLAGSIDALNKERQQMTLEAQERARQMLEAAPDAPLTLVGHDAFHQGIIGLVASRLVESFGRPAVVYQRGESESRGSCRSIVEYDITSGLRSCGELFERYGGHKQAGGFTIRNDRLEELEVRLLDHAGTALAGYDLTPTLDIDAEWPLNELRSQEIRWLGKLEPFGQANPEATLLSRNVLVSEARTVGEDGQHLRLKLKAGPVVWPAIAFRWEGELPQEGSRIDVVYSLSADRYGPSDNGGALQLSVLDIAVQA
jgi:single-stranded-DNA-specific exonuclease